MKKIFLILLLIFSAHAGFAEDFIILHTSDVHGRIAPIIYKDKPDIAGFSRRVKFINDIKSKHENVLVLDSGDYFQGSLYYRVYKGKASAKLMKYAQIDAIALGNHEFDDGIDILKRNIKLSKTQFLCANVKFDDDYLKKAVKPYIIKNIDDEKVLIIGVITSSLSNLSKCNDIEILNPIIVIKQIIESVEADKVIIISHCGQDEDRKIARDVQDVDLILGGHNHFFYKTPEFVNGVPIIQDGEFGVGVGVIEFDTDDGFESFYRQKIDNSIQSDSVIDKQIAKLDNHLKYIKNKVIARTELTLMGDQNYIERNQSNLGKLVLKSMVIPFNSYDVVLVQSGSIRVNRNIKDVITYSDVLEILPFDGSIVRGDMQGVYLKKALKRGTATGRRYLQYFIIPEKIDDDKFYKVVTTDYIASGKDGYEEFLNLKNIEYVRINPSKLLADFLKKNSVITEKTLVLP